MSGFGVALAWMIISPFAFLTDCLSIIVILHYKPLYHTCDVAFISLFVTMATNAWLLLPIPAVVKLADVYWSQSLCAFYTWLSITFRCSHILVLLVLNLYWMASLRVSNKSNLFISSKPITVSVCICWFISLVIGLIPAADVAHLFDYYEDNKCKFLPANISRGFAIFFIIVPLVTTVMGVVSSLDSLLLFKAMKDVALTKYSADRFHLPTISGGIRTSALIHAKYNELNVTIELCRLVLFFSMASSVLNAVPLLASQFVQLIQYYSRETLETTLLWLLLMEALVLPHLLWLLSRRYRHAVAYTWRVFVLRDTSAREDDAASCSLQAFRLNVKAVTSRPYRNGGVNTRQMNGTVPGADIEDHSQETTRNGDYNTPRSRTNSFLHTGPISGHENRALEYSLDSSGVTTDIEIELTPVKRITSPEVVILHETSHQGIRHAQMKGQGYNNVHETSLSLAENNKRDILTDRSSVVISDSSAMKSTQSPVKSPTKTWSAGQVKRSISASSRIEWKERMMKKHLPTVFLGSSVEDESDTDPTSGSVTHAEDTASKIPMETGIQPAYTSSARQDTTSLMSANWSSTGSTYYLSGDYHYDPLNNTLVRTHPHTTAELGESSERYAEEDINNILDSSLTNETITDNFLNNVNSGENVSNSELINSPTHDPQKIKNLVLKSAEIHHQKINNSENVSSIISKVDVPHKGSPIQERSKGVPDDRTLLVGRSHAENLSQPTATIISVSAVQPNIRRSNYRKFLAYTDLIISDVDDVTNIGNLEQDERNGDDKMKDFTSKSENRSEGGISPNKDLSSGKDTKDSYLSEHPQNLQTNEKRDTFATGKKKTNEEVDDYVQDYNKCETVSGSEMLRLKMQSIRSAAAMYFSDDTTSDDGGIDNNGFTETSNDDSDDNTDQYMKTPNIMFDNPKITRNDMHSVNNGSNEFASTLQVSDAYAFAEIRNTRDRVGDGEESAVDVLSHGKSVDKSYQDVRGKGHSQRGLSAKVDDKSKGQNEKEAYIVMSDKQSGDSQIEKSIIRNDTQRGDNQKEECILRNDKQREVSQNETSFISNDNQGLKSGGRSESFLTDHVKIVDNLLLSEQDKAAPWNVGRSKQNNLRNDSYTGFTDVTSNEHTMNGSSGSGVASSVSELHALPDENSTHATTRQLGVIAKPPRHRKHEDENQMLMYNAVKDNITGEEVDFEESTTPKSSPYSGITNYVIPVAETAVDSDISEVTDSDSIGSDLSVTLEPYGYRRPDWMNDLLLETSSYEQTMYKKAREFSSLEEESTDFMSNNNGNISNEFNLRMQGSPEKNGISYKGVQVPNVSSQKPQPLLIPYQFDDYSDTGNENSIIIDYSAQSNFYRNKNLCFEAITEEPEDLSDSASSIDNPDFSTSNILRDTPVTSYRQPISNFATKSISATSINQPYSNKPPQFHQNISEVSMDSLTIPTSERTSADGSEEIPPANGSTCLSSMQTVTNSSIHPSIRNKQHAMQQDSSLKDLANQTAHTSTIPALKTVNSTAIQSVHSSSGTLKDDVQASVTPKGSVIHKHDPMTTSDHTSNSNQYNYETLDYRPGSNGSTHVVTNSRSLDFYNGVQFPHTKGPESSRGEVPGATPVYF